MKEIENRTVYICFATEFVHSGHIAIIRQASKLGRVIAGVLSDEAIASYRRKPLFSLEERMNLFRNIKGIAEVVVQDTLSYAGNLRKFMPTYVVHGDDWRDGRQKTIREEVVNVLAEYGGKLVELPYSRNEAYEEVERRLASL